MEGLLIAVVAGVVVGVFTLFKKTSPPAASAPLSTTSPIVQVTAGAPVIVAVGSIIQLTPLLGYVFSASPTTSKQSVLNYVFVPGTSTPVPGQFTAIASGSAQIGSNMYSLTNPNGPLSSGVSTITVQ